MTMAQPSMETVKYVQGTTVLGEAVAFTTSKGLCALRLLAEETLPQILKHMRGQFRDARFVEDQSLAKKIFGQIQGWLDGKKSAGTVALDLHGTEFQKRVWKELLRVPHGKTRSYTELAQRVGRPRAVRAVASACARNPVGLLVPCHRIVRQDGSLGGYYWGLENKRKLLEHEQKKALKK
jgi:AraC family transcriptional regulator, regulatory protein of adaptative response / methylated-DNA-[protein]-cysteine methyltransferase